MNKIKGKHSIPEYHVRRGMIERCTNPSHLSYKKYGGRGISVCARWRESFENFYEDMGPRPSPKHTLERVDNDKGYEPGNCKWATWKEQAGNRSNSSYWSDEQEAKLKAMWEAYVPLDQISRELGKPTGAVKQKAFRLKLKRDKSVAILASRVPGLIHIISNAGEHEFKVAARRALIAQKSLGQTRDFLHVASKGWRAAA